MTAPAERDQELLSDPEAMKKLLGHTLAGFAPPPRLMISEFADRELIVATGPYAGTHWRTDFAPYERDILNAFHERGIEVVVVMGSSQWGKTACAVVFVAYHIKHDPCRILVVEPTKDPMAKDFAQKRLEPTIQATPALLQVVSRRRAKDSSNTTLSKTFRGGAIDIGGANSAASLAARDIRALVLDEIDRYPRELVGEGDTIEVALKRTASFGRRRRVFMLSSPSIEDGPIHTWFQRGDQRRFFVPCPSCGEYFFYQWRHMRWTDNDPATARLQCPTCDHGLDDIERVAVQKRGEWRATIPCAGGCGEILQRDVKESRRQYCAACAPGAGQLDAAEGPEEPRDETVVSFALWEAYSVFSSLARIVRSFLRARSSQKRGDSAPMHTWQNVCLAEPYRSDQGKGIRASTLLLRRELYEATVPAGACALIMSVDTQDDRLEALVIGWGPGEESWIVDHHRLDGDTSQDDVWDALDDLLDREYVHASGTRLGIMATTVDSAGHRTKEVYTYVEKRAARRVFAIIGRDGPRLIVSAPSARKWGRNKRKVPLYTVGVDACKALWMDRLKKVDEPGPGYVHFPVVEWCEEEFLAQLVSERLVSRFERGVRVERWEKIRARNEILDLANYNLAALRLMHPDLAALAARLGRPVSPTSTHEAPTPGGDSVKPTWIPRREGGWLKGRHG